MSHGRVAKSSDLDFHSILWTGAAFAGTVLLLVALSPAASATHEASLVQPYESNLSVGAGAQGLVFHVTSDAGGSTGWVNFTAPSGYTVHSANETSGNWIVQSVSSSAVVFRNATVFNGAGTFGFTINASATAFNNDLHDNWTINVTNVSIDDTVQFNGTSFRRNVGFSVAAVNPDVRIDASNLPIVFNVSIGSGQSGNLSELVFRPTTDYTLRTGAGNEGIPPTGWTVDAAASNANQVTFRASSEEARLRRAGFALFTVNVSSVAPLTQDSTDTWTVVGNHSMNRLAPGLGIFNATGTTTTTRHVFAIEEFAILSPGYVKDNHYGGAEQGTAYTVRVTAKNLHPTISLPVTVQVVSSQGVTANTSSTINVPATFSHSFTFARNAGITVGTETLVAFANSTGGSSTDRTLALPIIHLDTTKPEFPITSVPTLVCWSAGAPAYSCNDPSVRNALPKGTAVNVSLFVRDNVEVNATNVFAFVTLPNRTSLNLVGSLVEQRVATCFGCNPTNNGTYANNSTYLEAGTYKVSFVAFDRHLRNSNTSSEITFKILDEDAPTLQSFSVIGPRAPRFAVRGDWINVSLNLSNDYAEQIAPVRLDFFNTTGALWHSVDVTSSRNKTTNTTSEFWFNLTIPPTEQGSRINFTINASDGAGNWLANAGGALATMQYFDIPRWSVDIQGSTPIVRTGANGTIVTFPVFLYNNGSEADSFYLTFNYSASRPTLPSGLTGGCIANPNTCRWNITHAGFLAAADNPPQPVHSNVTFFPASSSMVLRADSGAQTGSHRLNVTTSASGTNDTTHENARRLMFFVSVSLNASLDGGDFLLFDVVARSRNATIENATWLDLVTDRLQVNVSAEFTGGLSWAGNTPRGPPSQVTQTQSDPILGNQMVKWQFNGQLANGGNGPDNVQLLLDFGRGNGTLFSRRTDLLTSDFVHEFDLDGVPVPNGQVTIAKGGSARIGVNITVPDKMRALDRVNFNVTARSLQNATGAGTYVGFGTATFPVSVNVTTLNRTNLTILGSLDSKSVQRTVVPDGTVSVTLRVKNSGSWPPSGPATTNFWIHNAILVNQTAGGNWSVRTSAGGNLSNVTGLIPGQFVDVVWEFRAPENATAGSFANFTFNTSIIGTRVATSFDTVTVNVSVVQSNLTVSDVSPTPLTATYNGTNVVNFTAQVGIFGSRTLTKVQLNVSYPGGSIGPFNMIPVGSSGLYYYLWGPLNRTGVFTAHVYATSNLSEQVESTNRVTFRIEEPNPENPTVVASSLGPNGQSFEFDPDAGIAIQADAFDNFEVARVGVVLSKGGVTYFNATMSTSSTFANKSGTYRCAWMGGPACGVLNTSVTHAFLTGWWNYTIFAVDAMNQSVVSQTASFNVTDGTPPTVRSLTFHGYPQGIVAYDVPINISAFVRDNIPGNLDLLTVRFTVSRVNGTSQVYNVGANRSGDTFWLNLTFNASQAGSYVLNVSASDGQGRLAWNVSSFQVAANVPPSFTNFRPGSVGNATPVIEVDVLHPSVSSSGIVLRVDTGSGFQVRTPAVTTIPGGLRLAYAFGPPSGNLHNQLVRVNVTATDATGLSSSADFEFRVDHRPPELSAACAVIGLGCEPVGTARPVGLHTPIRIGAAENASQTPVSGVASVQYKVIPFSGGQSPTCGATGYTAISGTTGTLTLDAALPANQRADGDYLLCLRAEDGVGNVALPPTASQSSAVLRLKTSGPVFGSHAVTAGRTVTVDVLSTDVCAVRLRVGEAPTGPFPTIVPLTRATAAGTAWSGQLPDRDETLYFILEAEDCIGNSSEKRDDNGQAFRFDSTNRAPVLALARPAANATLSGVATIAWNATDADQDVLTFFVVAEGPGGVVSIANNTALRSVTWNTTAVANGVWVIGVTASDGQHLVSVNVTVRVSNEPPVIDQAGVDQSEITEGGSVLLTVRLRSGVNATSVQAIVTGGGQQQTIDLYDDGTNGDSTAGDGIWSVIFTPGQKGTHTVDAVVTLASGEVQTVRGVATFRVADGAPSLLGNLLLLLFVASATVALAAYGAFVRWRP